MSQLKTKMAAGGRVVIPSEYRHALGIEPGDELILSLEENTVRISTPAEAIKRAQALVRRHVPKGRKLSEELIAERRAEAKRE